MARNNIVITPAGRLPAGPAAPSVLHGTIVTLARERRDYRRCRCSKCGIEDVCTPRTDFVPAPDGTLNCKRCSK